MLEFLNQIRKFIVGLFGANIPEEQWEAIPVEALTPREALLRRASLILFWAAMFNLLVGIVCTGMAVYAGTNDTTVFTSARQILLANFMIADDTAMLLVIAGILANVAILLILSVAITAQEVWTVLVHGC